LASVAMLLQRQVGIRCQAPLKMTMWATVAVMLFGVCESPAGCLRQGFRGQGGVGVVSLSLVR
jgi:hypothetical protein